MHGPRSVPTENPFMEAIATELIDTPDRYRALFSPAVLVGENLQLYRPVNAVLTGPLSSGKTMLLNLMRYSVMSSWLNEFSAPPEELAPLPPFLGISVNLTRAGFQTFGRRSGGCGLPGVQPEEGQAAAAADYLTHYLFREFLNALLLLASPAGTALRDWLRVHNPDEVGAGSAASGWSCWHGYYSGTADLQAIRARCEDRLRKWDSYLNLNVESVPSDVWETKASPQEALHEMGNLLSHISSLGASSAPLFVSIDQYEELRALGGGQGAMLQRVVNTLLKARDPAVYYKLGVRTHDWGHELRVWGSDATIEAGRDYIIIDLRELLMREENPRKWTFERFAVDVTRKRIQGLLGGLELSDQRVRSLFAPKWNADEESRLYFQRNGTRAARALIGGLPVKLADAVVKALGDAPSPLSLWLAACWVRQRLQREETEEEILSQVPAKPWSRKWWVKERRHAALLQIASIANERKRYYGWRSIVYLSGGNIYAFLLICSHMWDVAVKQGYSPLEGDGLPINAQTYGIRKASSVWLERDMREHEDGPLRSAFVQRLRRAIRAAVVDDRALSNPGHSGFSLDELELAGAADAAQVRQFLEKGVGWAFFEERKHTPKQRGKGRRRKFYLHPLLAPELGIPYIRVKEPYYVELSTVWEWIFSPESTISFSRDARKGGSHPQTQSAQQLRLGEME